ncbi:hypothetical protein D779_0233 [Imhoffiella purpurea]|uniref:Uncharacterized protein n=1 Tax=Imhoffiella purpurea TaxID=1249627 RepID=W9V4K7_9GAMM|nr:hypothetical protein D779_0233 [Imhoffiella purpurea]
MGSDMGIESLEISHQDTGRGMIADRHRIPLVQRKSVPDRQ